MTDTPVFDQLEEEFWPKRYLVATPDQAAAFRANLTGSSRDGTWVITDARLMDVSLVADPPHPLWTVTLKEDL